MRYSAETYRTAKLELDKRRNRAFTQQQKNKSIFYQKYPRAYEIEREIASTAVKVAKEIFSNKANATERLNTLKEINFNLQEELVSMLISAGFPENYLDEQYTCNLCRDTGYIDGKMCDCMKRILRDMAYNEFNKKSPLSLCDFSTFDLTLYPSESLDNQSKIPKNYMSKVFDYCTMYASNFNINSRNLFFTGDTGLGKTHLSLAIANEVIVKGFGVIYFSVPNLVNQLEQERFHKLNNDDENTEKILNECDLLILDDLGTEVCTSFTTTAVYNLINTRLTVKKPLLINTNLSLKDIEQRYSKRLSSRIIGDFDIMNFIGRDIRQLKRQQRKYSFTGGNYNV